METQTQAICRILWTLGQEFEEFSDLKKNANIIEVPDEVKWLGKILYALKYPGSQNL